MFCPWLLFVIGDLLLAQPAIRGFSSVQLESERQWEEKARALPTASRIRTYLRRMSREPHHAGSPGSRAVAEYALGLFKEWGLDARIETYEALLPYPTSRIVEVVSPVRFRAQLAESALAEDGDSGSGNQVPTFNAYSGSGDVTAPLLYVNYGLPEDYDYLKRLGINAKGKIVIARYGKSWRGTKPKVAAEQGAVGCILYSDPREDGYFQGDVYPAGPYRPAQGVQRGSVMDMPLHVGDPLSPGWASEPGSKRLAMAEAKSLMKIPVQPMSYQDAQSLLEQLSGAVAPEAWRGALAMTYHIGPGPAKVRMKLEFDNTTKPLYDVIATIPGSEFPDQWIVYGNHHDAWVHGASDPLSGVSALLETARTLSELKKAGWQPKRTIRLALWDGEEFGLIGSTEWVEKHGAELDRKLVAYLNSDSTGKGGMAVGGSHSLETFVMELLRDVTDPVSGKSLMESRREGSTFHLGALGAGSDYVPFLHHAGVASLNMGFGGEGVGGVYHSIYDSFAWYTRFSDGEFVYGRAFSGWMATALMRLAGAALVPFEFTTLQRTIQRYVQEMVKDSSGKVEWKEFQMELGKLGMAAKNFEVEYQGALKRMPMAGREKLGAVNEVIYRTERAFTLGSGLPGRPWYRHLIYAPGRYTGYGAKTLPGVREAVEAGKWDEASEQARQVGRAIRALTLEINKAAVLLRGL